MTKIEIKTIRFKEWNCCLSVTEYPNGTPRLQLYDMEDGGPIATATVIIADHAQVVPKGYVAIKDYSEGKGMLQALTEAGVVGLPEAYIPSGYVVIPICKLLFEVT